MGDSEIPTARIGALVMEALAKIDQVAYVRYASVYKDFREAQDFNEFLETLKPEEV
jgi:transcriptional repressor NrdR